jgi:DNA-binding MarR family transcriptional regulator
MDLPKKNAYLFLAIRKLSKYNSVSIFSVLLQSANEKNIATINQSFLAENLNIDRKTVYTSIEDLVEKDLIIRKRINDDLYFELSGSIKNAVEAALKPMNLVNDEYQKLKKDYSFLYVKKKKENEKNWQEQLKEAEKKAEYRKKRREEYKAQESTDDEDFWSSFDEPNKEIEEPKKEIEDHKKEIEEPQTVPSILANSKAAKEIKTLLGKSNV